ncbi:MAG: exonuclease subunit SbcD [Cyanophyceae cyanobacterium]
MVKILHLSDIHLGSGLSHGRIDPATGMNTRLQDFVATLGRCMDRAIADPVDLVLFGGDAFPDATPPPLVQQAFAQQFRRLADAKIPTVLLVGNHDQHAQGKGGASLSIYRTLGVPGFVVGDTLTTHRLETTGGPVQVVTLPWLTRSALLTKPETEGLSLGEVSRLLLERLDLALEGEVRQLDPNVPAILLGHVMSDRASLGAERFLGVGKGFSIPLSAIARPEFDYVALGHVHRHQNLNPNNDPPVIYPGSIERVDFSEEKEDKGFVLVTIESFDGGGSSENVTEEIAAESDSKAVESEGESDSNGAKDASETESRSSERPFLTEWEFCALPVRKFCTIHVDLSDSDNPHGKLLKAVKPEVIDDAVVRLIYRLQADQLGDINTTELYQALAIAHSYTVNADLVSQLARPRLPSLTSGKPLDPLEALQFYLDSRDDLQDMSTDLMAAAESLLGYRLAERSRQNQQGVEGDGSAITGDAERDSAGNDFWEGTIQGNDKDNDKGSDREFVPVTQADLDTIPVEQLNLL